jgi:cell division protein FtsZ
VTVVATGLSRQGQAPHAPPLQVLRTGTDNVPFNVPTINNAVGGPGAIVTRESSGRARSSRTTAAWPCRACGAPTAPRPRPRSTRCPRGGMDDFEIPAFLRKQAD